MDAVQSLSPPKVQGLFETHLTVSDLDRSIEFYREIIGLPLALELRERGAAFFWIGGSGEAMLGLWSLGSAPMALSLHIAMTASLGDVLTACEALRSQGVIPLSFFGTETTEPSVIGWMPAAAVYFRDPDGHLIEYLAMLNGPARPELGIVPWSRWPSADPEPIKVEPYTGPREQLRALFEEAEDSADQLDAYIEAGDVLVAVTGNRAVGHLQLLTDGDGDGVGEIKSMAVEAAHRHRSIGRTLIEAAIELARTRGCSALLVGTAAGDVGNLRFYQRVGFRLRSVEHDAFSRAAGYAPGTMIDGIPLLDRVWLALDLDSHI